MSVELYASVTNRMQRASFAKTLTAIVAATVDPTKGALPISKVTFEKMAAADTTLIEANAASIVGEGDKATIVVRATTAGIAAVKAAPAPSETPKVPLVPVNYAIEDGIPVPEIRRGGDRTQLYPFDRLAVGQSFFVAATDQMPNPAKTLGSTVSSATRRAKTQTPPRVYTIRGNEKGPDGTTLGARIWRVAPETATPGQTTGDNPAAN